MWGPASSGVLDTRQTGVALGMRNTTGFGGTFGLAGRLQSIAVNPPLLSPSLFATATPATVATEIRPVGPKTGTGGRRRRNCRSRKA